MSPSRPAHPPFSQHSSFQDCRPTAFFLPDSCQHDPSILGDRDAAVVREMTKIHEQVRRGTLAELAAAYAGESTPKGEIVIVVGPPKAERATSDADLDAMILDALAHQSLRDASAMIAAATGRPRRDVYARALALSTAREGSRPATR
jgi:16S rRNA (cytidine1402-2'-O)-methyltransferase